MTFGHNKSAQPISDRAEIWEMKFRIVQRREAQALQSRFYK